MKVKELIEQLQSRHPDAEVEIYVQETHHPDAAAMLRAHDHEYELWSIVGVGDWGAPGTADDLVTINLGHLMGC